MEGAIFSEVDLPQAFHTPDEGFTHLNTGACPMGDYLHKVINLIMCQIVKTLGQHLVMVQEHG